MKHPLIDGIHTQYFYFPPVCTVRAKKLSCLHFQTAFLRNRNFGINCEFADRCSFSQKFLSKQIMGTQNVNQILTSLDWIYSLYFGFNILTRAILEHSKTLLIQWFFAVSCTVEPACKVHRCKVFSDVRLIFSWSQSESAILSYNPDVRPAC